MTASEQGLGRRSEELVRHLTEQIRRGEIVPGDRLPPERELCSHYQLSRTTVRRAMSRLATDGYIENRHGVGNFVKGIPAPPAKVSRTISVMFSLDMELFAHMQHLALEQKYMLCPFPRGEMGWEPERERAFLQQVLHERHHALLAFCTPRKPDNSDLLAQLEENGTRVLHVEYASATPPAQNYLLPNYREAGFLAAQDLHRAGYERLFFAHTQPFPIQDLLLEGFLAGVKILRGEEEAARAVYTYPKTNLPLAGKKAEIQAVLRKHGRSVGFLCPTSPMGVEMSMFAREMGWNVPEDFGVIGLPHLDMICYPPTVDTLDFDRRKHLEAAFACVVADAWGEVRDYVSPYLTRRGSVRTAEE